MKNYKVTHKLAFIILFILSIVACTENDEVQNEVTNEPVIFTAVTQAECMVNQSIPINFTLTPPVTTSNTTYLMNYVLSSGTGYLIDLNSTILPQGVYDDVTIGNFTYTYYPTTAGTHTLTFKLMDSNGAIYTATVTITVSS
ncbi:uncharacterized protein DUF3872 [Flavobacterium croceum DSM 17960]|uniref:Uncharacterized protein DUF3872 n=1 Tax=Flavobacterium croceum DSM 17960 TaxID=1121886 RepID=A0A2S4N584_9FLAO|nr:TraQ conjugal transfer family protein [Flavobacterium croceum]POS00899.1 uncharacterized protein DUF3872 [Flavobacterium croceum DSM 17960]